jgi:hypothetical protein
MEEPQMRYYVFDLDDTIIKTGDIKRWTTASIEEIGAKAVPEIVEFLKTLRKAREAGEPVKIFLLTNNSAEDYIEKVEAWLENPADPTIGKTFFDNKLWFGAPGRNGGLKRLEDVALMAGEPPTESLAARTWFFDDMDTHQLMNELPAGHYIVVNPDGQTAGIPSLQVGGQRRRVRQGRGAVSRRKSRTSKKVGRSRRRR